MKPAPFDYCRPSTVDEAVEALGSNESARVLAGGQSLIPAMNFRLTDVSLLVDIGQVEGLDRVSVEAGGVTVGAAATQSRVLADDDAAGVVPRPAGRAAPCGTPPDPQPGHGLRQPRPRRPRPRSCPPSRSRPARRSPSPGRQDPAGSRRPTSSWGPFWTALDDGELVTEVRFPAPPAGSVTVVDEISRRAGDFAVAGLIAVIDTGGGAVRSARLVCFGVGGSPTRLESAETAISGWTGADGTGAIADAVLADTADAFDDIHATSWYRREAVAALVVRAARTALGAREARMTINEPISEVDVEVTINGRPHRHRVPARLLLSDYIRDTVGLTGTHLGCEHGYCGACTIIVDGDAVRSCLMLAVQADGCEVRTVEDLAPAGSDALSPMQQAFHDNHALQCGFCTAGFLMTLESVDPDQWREPERMVELLSGNLCRCTGYQNIVAAVSQAWSAYDGSGGPDDG